MDSKLVSVIIISTILDTTLGLGLSYVSLIAPLNTRLDDLGAELDEINSSLQQIQTLSEKTAHAYTLHWNLQQIQSGSAVTGYVKSWTVPEVLASHVFIV